MSNSSKKDLMKKNNLEKTDSELTTGTPRWVKVFGGLIVILVLLAIIMMLFGKGEHGPGRYLSFENVSQTVPEVYKVPQT
ncbi:hypothetical protein [Domibacillus robiginosus]|uniref:hypothetical protein n=1 Tax=Domibacillus robiginosus TaxID=1071054 RepID=UPI00067B1397|nr:hypothetical protein [Domibacillus robiginosus]